MTIYLYVKTHRVTGLKYLGKTTAKNPYKYKGSGVYWTKHIAKHGYDVDTEILYECQNKEEVRKWGLYYSKLWDIVNSVDENGKKIWANLTIEEGQGGWSGMNTPEQIESNRIRCLIDNPIHKSGAKEKCKENTKKAMWDPVIRAKYLHGINSESWKKARDERTGNKAPSYDHTIYTFQHDDGRKIQCTQYELANKYNVGKQSAHRLSKKKVKKSKGWQLIE